MRNVLVTGAGGQLGSELQLLSKEYEGNFYFTDKENLDIAQKEAVKRFLQEHKITHIINAAAYTAVDKAEEEEALADAINHKAVKHLAEAAKNENISLVHISTDYVFDGKNYKPYTEDDITNPQSAYGRTKRKGEEAMLAVNPQRSVIIRTSWVYSSFGNNFVKTMLRLGKEREKLGVIFNQVGTPTYARDLARTILDILPKIKNENVEIYHFSNEGVLSWYDFAKEIMKMAKIECRVDPIETKEYPTPAPRPHYSLLNKAKIKQTFQLEIPYWKESLDACLRVLGERK